MKPLRRHDPAEAIRRSLEKENCIPVDIRVIGEDPGNRAIRSVVVYRIPDSMYHSGLYIVADYWDHTGSIDTFSGITSSTVVFDATRTEAIAEANSRVSSLMSDYTWFVPGTDELVPGCWGYME